jgi:hypothetical protein
VHQPVYPAVPTAHALHQSRTFAVDRQIGDLGRYAVDTVEQGSETVLFTAHRDHVRTGPRQRSNCGPTGRTGRTGDENDQSGQLSGRAPAHPVIPAVAATMGESLRLSAS